ncbi:MAG: 2-succinyl-5-enolpyruvyl-6-hydroxy-3-cyclohexene-1-carboxylic-acid synthase [Ilumatobacter coccineus]|uniref:2-succinyl-5-enolpyruvyl-6-hydroxy-3-cyclohexene-1-carboxylate synthase n=1 Tax=Ilumatobacter coccineus TaxID=467094 RepID=A0A2G6KDM1_9ACTN|nr:MAG: 2-succinyl-5-enolpyruvyl-6-hydroxy-3-cyclohexene-1-carboxylic-acid synthase [Ilumatobacter coccineus]
MSAIGNANATACATLVDEWIAQGLRHAVISPGSRSTPLAIAAAERDEMTTHIVLDERSAGFVALGIGLDETPALLICTSGTAAANYLPAVVEADLSNVPILVCTADRPPELRGIGSPQTIDQIELYGSAVRWFCDVPPPDEADPASWRPLARQAAQLAVDGPAHLNLPFREPLVGTVGHLPPPLTSVSSVSTARPAIDLGRYADTQRGIIVAGGRSGVDPNELGALAERLRWPILADPLSGLRGHPQAVVTADALVREPCFAQHQIPDLVVRVGRAPASKVISQWSEPVPVIQIGGPGTVDPERNVVVTAELADLEGWMGSSDRSWLDGWITADQVAEGVLADLLSQGDLSEPAIARLVADTLPDDVDLVVSSSMPVRDIEWFGGRRARAHANRGANGIDGVVSTAVGRALVGRSVAVLIGDLAFLHDANALLALTDRGVDLRIVVIDNGGGGIFSFLPQATHLNRSRFEELFGTPHGTDIISLARAHRIDATTVNTRDELIDRLHTPGPSVTRVVSDRAANVTSHRCLVQAVHDTLTTRRSITD